MQTGRSVHSTSELSQHPLGKRIPNQVRIAFTFDVYPMQGKIAVAQLTNSPLSPSGHCSQTSASHPTFASESTTHASTCRGPLLSVRYLLISFWRSGPGWVGEAIALSARVVVVDKRGWRHNSLLHKEHIIQKNLINVKRGQYPTPNCNMDIVRAHQNIGILAHVSVRMSLDNALDSPTGVEFLRGHINCHWVQRKPSTY